MIILGIRNINQCWLKKLFCPLIKYRYDKVEKKYYNRKVDCIWTVYTIAIEMGFAEIFLPIQRILLMRLMEEQH